MKRTVKIGTRQSPLALWQAEHMAELLGSRNPSCTFVLVPMRTKGDKLLDVPLAKIGDKGLFTKELEIALLEGEIDLAVHSMKDLPTILPPGLIIGAITRREDPRDALISRQGNFFSDLPRGAIIGTGSLRRRAQLLHARPDLNLADLRGNIDTRLKRLDQGDFTAVILAAAGVDRLGLGERITERLDYSISLPAIGQGALGLEIRDNDEEMAGIIRGANDAETSCCIRVERDFLRTLEGGCQIPIGAMAQIQGGKISLQGMVASLDGHRMLKDSISVDKTCPGDLGITLARKLLAQGADEILNKIRVGDC
ncbi:MAG: Porphobilinogen deaminase [Dehalococcoidia bacterium]|nr:Porphobilinogen deaminase [Bacillota bacterium]MBT9141637.1 Porphobilinogen deaminase [Bacillota bacterium]